VIVTAPAVPPGVKVDPFRVPTLGLPKEKLTGRPELAVAVSDIGGALMLGLVGVLNVIACCRRADAVMV
jgi:hypothetical protein